MQITHSSAEGTTATTRGPAVWFTGDVDIDPVAASPALSRVQAVHFMPGADPPPTSCPPTHTGAVAVRDGRR